MKPGQRHKFWRKFFFCLLLVALLFVLLLAHPIFHLARTAWYDRNQIVLVPGGKANDASRLEETTIAQTWEIPNDPGAAEKQLAALIEYARTNHLKISIAGARHTMGGHTIYPGGIVIDMLPFNRMALDETHNILHVQAGARWFEIIEFLNAHGRSVYVMQSNDDFSVGGSLSVNCHGWQFGVPPIASTVESFRLMLPTGKIVKCSRSENPELFSLVLGGYGLFGIILDADLHVVPNERYQIERISVSKSDYAKVLAEKTADTNGIAMIYGRLRVTSQNFLQDGVINIFRCVLPPTNLLVSALGQPKDQELERVIFRSGVNSDYGKELRWDAEKYFSAVLAGDIFDRNNILYEPSDWFSDHSTNSTDILVECFVPPHQFAPFVKDLQKIIPDNHADLLNVTVRDVNADHDTFLKYADKDMISLVMLFSQERNAAGEARMAAVTQEMIASALKHDGRYYLPYRLHATPEQFAMAYPQAKDFFALKRKYDPDELFQNEFYLKYGK
ncbi:MAG TPA: FAD-binding oxidoreductase [Pseudomonadales bacterium]|nr:FAD-binding oxidoreductase [Pseudomonadales bacterium]